MATLITEVPAELLTLAVAKAYAKVTHSLEDSIFTSLISAARKQIQAKTGYAIGRQVYRETRFIRGEVISQIQTPLYPLASFVVTLDGTEVDTTGAIVDTDTGIVHLAEELTGSKLSVDWTVGTLDLASTEADIVDAWKAQVAFLNENRGADDQVAMPASIAATLARHRIYRV